jgi:hypothetical protein
VNAALVAEFGEFFGVLDTRELVTHLKDGMNDVSKNDLRGCEAMLYSQAQAQSHVSLVVIHAPLIRRLKRRAREDHLQGAAVGADTHLAGWEKTTGPKTPQGQAKVSRNAYKAGTRPILRELARLLREQGEALKRIGRSQEDARVLGAPRGRPYGDSRRRAAAKPSIEKTFKK